MRKGQGATFRVIRHPRLSLRWIGELAWNLAMQRVTVRYKETIFGFGWILLQPVALTFVFTYLRRIADIPTGDTPYPLFAAIGLVAWSFTSLVVSQSAASLAGNGVLLKRVALPRFVFPLSALLAALADLAVMLILLAALFWRYGLAPPAAGLLWLPFLFGLHLALLLGLGFILSTLHVFLRDVGFATPHLLWLWFFASPVFYPASMVPREFALMAKWNPMVGLLEGYRAVLLQGIVPPMDFLLPAAAVTCLLLAAGVACFWRLGPVIADML